MAMVWIGVAPGTERLPYGTRGQRKHKGPKRSIVDFGKRGTFRVPNQWLLETKPDPKRGRILTEAARIATAVLADMAQGQ